MYMLIINQIPISQLVYMVGIWLVIVILAKSIFSFFYDGWRQVQILHQIPCSQCTYFTDDYHLKCTLHPYDAGSTEAINCRDYEQKQSRL